MMNLISCMGFEIKWFVVCMKMVLLFDIFVYVMRKECNLNVSVVSQMIFMPLKFEQPIDSPVLLLRHCAEFLSAYIEKNFEEALEH